MNSDGLNNKQFITIAIIIILCGFLIIGHDYFMAKKDKAYQNMSLLLSQEPEVVEKVNDEVVEVVSREDTSGKVKKKNVSYNYAGRLIIPNINLNRGFLKYGQRGNNVDQNIAVMKGSTYPTDQYSHLVLAGHSGSGWNAFFTNLDDLSIGAIAYVKYNNKEYKYKLVKIYKDKQSDGGIDLYRHSNKKALTLVTCSRPDFKKYYLVLNFELVSENTI